MPDTLHSVFGLAMVLAVLVVLVASPGLLAPSAEVDVTVALVTAWPGGFTGELRIRNASDVTIDGWLLNTDHQDLTISSVWNAVIQTQTPDQLDIANESWNATIGPGQVAVVGFSGSGTLAASSFLACALNSGTCTLDFVDDTNNPPPPGNDLITIIELDTEGPRLEAVQPRGGKREYTLQIATRPDATFEVISSHPERVAASIVEGNRLRITGHEPGRARLHVRELGNVGERRLGVKIRRDDQGIPGLPPYLAIGSVSEDTEPDLAFWWDLETGRRNKRMDVRYIYLNGGPFEGWDTWTNVRGDRARRYIRESRRLGLIPFFVFYNIPDDNESYITNLEHIQSEAYLAAYYENLTLALAIAREEGGEDPVGFVLEPDFLGYLAQNADASASEVMAQTHVAYDAGILVAGIDPPFPNTVKGLVESINYIIQRDAPNALFGWQMNLWASPAGGFTTPIPGRGLIHLTDTLGIDEGRTRIAHEAAAITDYYLDAGVASHGADFLSIDKFGLDAGAEPGAAADPASSTWFWNSDHWHNYLIFVRAMHETSSLPVVLWQLPVGHINTSQATSPYAAGGLFPALDNTATHYEDSAGTFFLGDTFTATGVRFDHFAANEGNAPGISSSGDAVTWRSHMQAAADAGVIAVLFGAGVSISTDGVGTPPTDAHWWMTKVQDYYASPVPLAPAVIFSDGFETGDTSRW